MHQGAQNMTENEKILFGVKEKMMMTMMTNHLMEMEGKSLVQGVV